MFPGHPHCSVLGGAKAGFFLSPLPVSGVGHGHPIPTERGEGGPAQEGCGGVETPTLGWA